MKTTTKKTAGSAMHALRYATSSVLYLKFTVNGGKVKVHGCLGSCTYIDREMPLEEARQYWLDRVKEGGWAKCDFKDAPRDWWFWN